MIRARSTTGGARGVLAALALTALPACGGEEVVTIDCGIDISDVVEQLVIDPEAGTTTMRVSDWNPTERVGTATATEYRFDLAFPALQDRAELHYRIDRRTLQANRWFVNAEGEEYLEVEATCRSSEAE